MTRDQTPAHNTISLEKFAKRLASAVGRFMEVDHFSPFLSTSHRPYHINANNFFFPPVIGVLLFVICIPNYRRPIDFPVKSQIGGSAVEGSQKHKFY
jgi:hypothetical protein